MKSKKQGRPKNKIPTREVRIRWKVHIADWIERKRLVVEEMAEKDIERGER